MSEKDELTRMMDEPEPKDPDAKIPWCKLGYTVKDSKEKCPLGGCWKYRCYDSKLNATWHEAKEKHYAEKFGVNKMEPNKVYEIDVAYNPKLLDWLKQFHIQISHGANNITINVPFSSAKDYQYALKLLNDAINP